jgi:flavin reductase (DIM6/NTAB) family NADH-FMN oxidoreductase RutF
VAVGEFEWPILENGGAMNKHLIEPSDYLYPQPVVLVGVKVGDIPNFTTVSWVGIANETPPMISIALRHERYSLKGIKEYGVFSVNIPSANLVKETDYCGIVSGAQVNKAEACQFDVFYGTSDTIPMIGQCPINLECSVAQTMILPSHSLIVADIRKVHISEGCVMGGKSDLEKINPIAYITGITGQYHAVGVFLDNAYSAGKVIKN